MIRSITRDVLAAANVETVVDIISGSALKVRTIKSVWFEQVNGTDMICFVDQDRIADVGAEVNQADFQGVPIEMLLVEGQTFKCGFRNGTAGALTQKVTVFYDETGV